MHPGLPQLHLNHHHVSLNCRNVGFQEGSPVRQTLILTGSQPTTCEQSACLAFKAMGK